MVYIDIFAFMYSIYFGTCECTTSVCEVYAWPISISVIALCVDFTEVARTLRKLGK